MLALLVFTTGLLLTAADKAIPKDTNYIIRQNATCPSSGFFFQREVAPNHQGVCQLCFCHTRDSAVCWIRENRKCDLEHFQEFGQRNSRTRRSPLSLGEVFLRDAARDFFDKQSPEQCKPFESSFSDGCPPADWCIGCTVCDCDANGHWDCHVLSFCTDKNGKKQMKKRRPPRSRHAKKQPKKSTTKSVQSTKITTKPPKKPARKRAANPSARNNQVKKSSPINKHKINQVKGTTVNKIAAVKKPLRKVQTKKAMANRNKVTKRPLYIKKNMSTNKPLNIKSNSNKSVKNNTIDVAQKVVKQFMSTMQKMIKNIDKKPNNTATKQINKVLKKRSMPQKDNTKGTRKGEQNLKFVTKPVSNGNRKDSGNKNMPKSYNTNNYNHGRIKRQVTVIGNIAHKNDSTFLYKWNDSKIENGNSSQYLLKDDSTSSLLNILQILNNKTKNLTQSNNGMDPDVYITDRNIPIDTKRSMMDGNTIYNYGNMTDTTVLWAIDNYSPTEQNTSNIKVKNVISLTTSRTILSTNYTLSNISIINNTVSKENTPEEIKSHQDMVYYKEKQYSNASTQTENHDCKFRTLLQKLIGKNTDQYYNRNQTNETAKKPKRYTILTKIKRLFKKIFNKRNRNPFNHKDDFYYSDSNLKQLYSKKPEDYKLTSNVKEKLRQRIYELRSESENLLKTVGIIKGLLHILEINTNATQFKGSNNYLNGPNTYIDKLKLIVKNTYDMGNNVKKLTENQHIQIKYIKDNVQEFIKSIGKFARILDDVIRIAMYYNKKEHKINNANRNKNFNNMVEDDYKNMTYAKVQKLKKLILDYNILQNKFVHQIYVILNNLDKKVINKGHSHPTVHSIDLNKTDAIEINSANIIKNIRKLKLLAESMNLHKRPKREAINDDKALEYLLILMEYMLKRHKPSYSSVYDGLDLLIEAIKNAPDIKVIKNKPRDNTTKRTFVTRTTVPTNWYRKYSNYSSSAERKHKNDSPETNKGYINTIDLSEGDTDDDEDKIEEIYHSFKSNKYSSTEQKQDDMVLRANSMWPTSESYDNVKEATTRMSRDNNYKVVRFEPVHYSLEEGTVTSTSRTIDIERDTTTNLLKDKDDTVIEDETKTQAKSHSNNDNFLVDAKANIDWIEENFKEIKQLNEFGIISTTSKTLLPSRSSKPTDNRSDITNENKAYNEKKMDISSTEEVMSKKQLDLLNSLDYVEDETDSKDDKFLSDTYV